MKNSTKIWAVLRECGQEPLQIFWFRASIKFFNSMLDSNSKTLRRILKADLHLASFDNSCWSAQVSTVFNGLQGSAMFKQKMLRATQVPMQEFICDLRFRHLKVWREADFSCPRAVGHPCDPCNLLTLMVYNSRRAFISCRTGQRLTNTRY